MAGTLQRSEGSCGPVKRRSMSSSCALVCCQNAQPTMLVCCTTTAAAARRRAQLLAAAAAAAATGLPGGAAFATPPPPTTLGRLGVLGRLGAPESSLRSSGDRPTQSAARSTIPKCQPAHTAAVTAA